MVKAKVFKETYGAKLEFWRGEVGGRGGGAKQKPSIGGIRIWFGTTHLINHYRTKHGKAKPGTCASE